MHSISQIHACHICILKSNLVGCVHNYSKVFRLHYFITVRNKKTNETKNFKALPLSLFTFDISPIHFALFHSGSYAHHILLRTDIMGTLVLGYGTGLTF